MTPEAQRVAIAEACGWKRVSEQAPGMPTGIPFWKFCSRYCQTENLPDYLNDLNAIHEAENILLDDNISDASSKRYTYAGFLYNTTTPQDRQPCRATAARRCEALLRALGLWRDDAPVTQPQPSTPTPP